MERLLEHMKAVARAASQINHPSDRTEAYCASLGEDVMMKIMDAQIARYHDQDCLIHGDSHVFNILVEAKPSIKEWMTSAQMVLWCCAIGKWQWREYCCLLVHSYLL